jgi:hypothetical protein
VFFLGAEGEDLVDPREKSKVIARGIGFDIGAVDGDIELSYDSGDEYFAIEGVECVEESAESSVELSGRARGILRDEEFEDDCDIQMSSICTENQLS